MSAEHEKDPLRVAAGLKAAIHNPNVSEEAKERAVERLEELDGSPTADNHDTTASASDEHTHRQLGGYKATLTNPTTSEEAKRHAKEVLDAAGYYSEKPAGTSEEDHQIRVLAGYKAAISNPNVSDEAKQHAREVLAYHGEKV